MNERERLRSLVDDLPEEEVRTAVRFLEYLRNPAEEDPVAKALRDAPMDDEPLTDEDLAALREAEDDEAHGQLIPHAEVRRSVLG